MTKLDAWWLRLGAAGAFLLATSVFVLTSSQNWEIDWATASAAIAALGGWLLLEWKSYPNSISERDCNLWKRVQVLFDSNTIYQLRETHMGYAFRNNFFDPVSELAHFDSVNEEFEDSRVQDRFALLKEKSVELINHVSAHAGPSYLSAQNMTFLTRREEELEEIDASTDANIAKANRLCTEIVCLHADFERFARRYLS